MTAEKNPGEADKDPAKELDTAAENGATQTLTLADGREIDVLRCKVRHVAKTARFVNTVLLALGVDDLDGFVRLETAIQNPQVIVRTIERAYDDLIIVVEALTSLSNEEVLDLEIDDLISIIGKLWQMNSDFFSKRVAAALYALQAQGAEEENQVQSSSSA